MAIFKFVVDGELVTITEWGDIPDEFEHVISFIPDMPEPEGEDGEHTEEQHEELALWNTRLQEQMEKERASSM